MNEIHFSAMKQVQQDGNVRRENKLYSYKDQMEEMQLRKVSSI